MAMNGSNNGSVTAENGESSVTGYGRILGSLYTVTSLLVIGSNLTVVIVVIKSKKLHIPTLCNIAFMAMCDLFYGMHFLLFAAPSAFIGKFAFSDYMIAPTSITTTLLYGQNVLNIVLATFDRYISVCWPLRYNVLMTSRRFIIAIGITIFINICRLCLIVLPNVDIYYNPTFALCGPRFKTPVSTVASIGIPALSVIVIVIFILKMLVEIRRSRRRLVVPLGHTTRCFTFTFTILLSAGIFSLSYLPICITIVWNMVSGPEHVPVPLTVFGILCLLANSLWNVVIYATTYRPFRDAFLHLFCKKYFRKKRQMEVETVMLDSVDQ